MQVIVSVGQMDVRIGEPETNLDRVCSWTAEAARRGSNLVVFPELWDTSYALDRAVELGSPLGEGRFAVVANLARQYRIHITGSLLELSGAGKAVYNAMVWFTPDGALAGVYRKTHLFRLMNEDRYLTPGESARMLELPWGQTGMAICYDLRFPELFRGYGVQGAIMMVIPAQWPESRIAHWEILLRARAIENQMIVIGCNRVGQEGNVRFGGRSVVLNPQGVPLIEAGDEETLLTATVDIAQVEETRRKIPVFEDRRPDIYG